MDMRSRGEAREAAAAITAGEMEERRAGYLAARRKEEAKNLAGEAEDVSLSESLRRARRVVLGQRVGGAESVVAQLGGVEETPATEEVGEFAKRFKALMKQRETEKENEEEERKREDDHDDHDQGVKSVDGGNAVDDTNEHMGGDGEDAMSDVSDPTKQTGSIDHNDSDLMEEDIYEEKELGKGLSGVLELLRSQKSDGVEEEAYGRRNDRVVRDDDNKGTCDAIVLSRWVRSRVPRQEWTSPVDEGGLPPVLLPVPRKEPRKEKPGQEEPELPQIHGCQRCALTCLLETRMIVRGMVRLAWMNWNCMK